MQSRNQSAPWLTMPRLAGLALLASIVSAACLRLVNANETRGWTPTPAAELAASPFPPHNTNAWFVAVQPDGTEQVRQLVAAVTVDDKFGIPTVSGVWTNGKRSARFVAFPTTVPRRWFWMVPDAALAGVLMVNDDGSPHRVVWNDNQGCQGHLLTTT